MPIHEIGAVFVGPKSSVGWQVTHWKHGTGTVVGLDDLATVSFEHETLMFVAATANQQPKLIKTYSEVGKTIIANVKVKGMEVHNRDDDRLIGWVKQDWSDGTYYYVLNNVSKATKPGYQTKHAAVKALVNLNNFIAETVTGNGNSLPPVPQLTMDTSGSMASPWALPPKTEPMFTFTSKASAVPSFIQGIISAQESPGKSAPTTQPANQPAEPGDWQKVKEELNPNNLVGANPVKKAGHIVGGEIHFNGVKLGYTVSNGPSSGTMKVYHCDGTLVHDAAVPGKGHATNAIAAHHTVHYSGQAELIAELSAKVKNVVDGGKILPSERSLTEGGLHNQPHLAYSPPEHERVLKHFKDEDSVSDGTQVYASVHGAHFLKLTAAEKSAIDNYTHNGFSVINGALRVGKVTSVAMLNRIKALDKVFLKTLELEETITIYRGIDFSTAKLLLGEPGAKVGQMFTEPGYSSCSAYVASAFCSDSNIIMRITVPRGSHVVKPSKVGHYGDHEKEIMLPRQAGFLVFRDEMVQAGPYQKRQVDLVFTGSSIN